jgi:O-antigen ligase
VTTPALESTHAPGRLGDLVRRESLGALVLAASFPFLFLHERFQPDLAIAVGTTTVDLRLSDLAVVAVVAVALIAVARHGLARLRPSLALWIVGAAFLAWMAFEVLRPASRTDTAFDEHFVTFAKLVEYSALSVAVPLLVRSPRDLAIVLGAVVLWSAIATGVAVVQFCGADIFEASTAGWRYPSFLGRHDLAALSALAASIAAARILVGRRQVPAVQLRTVALVGGTLGLVLAGSVAAAGGFAVGSLALLLAAWRRFVPGGRRVLALGALVLTVILGVMTIRSSTLEDFLRFVGIHGESSAQGVESYSQRTVLAYIGLRIFQDHPVAGVGWQLSSRPDVFEPYVPDARKRFPDVVELAFPAKGREWGVQNLYIQMLADAGVIGLGLTLAVGAAGLGVAWRAAARAPSPWAAGAGLVAICALLTLAGEWASLGIVAGIPLQAATCIALGLAAAGAAAASEGQRG